MPQFPQTFNARQVEPIGSMSQLPVSDSNGWPVVIIKSEMEAVKDKADHGMLVLDLMIVDGEHKGEEGKYRLNLFHSNPKTVEIANRQLSSLCWVCGKPDARLSEELHNIPFRVVVTAQVGEGKENYTQVKSVKNINGNDPGKSGLAQQPAQQQAPAPPPAQPVQAQQQQAAAAPWGQPAAQEQPQQQVQQQTPWGQPAATSSAPANPPWAQPK